MKVKTYGVPELTEWHGKIKAGNIELAVSFTGGTSSPSGAQPAYFVTKDPITQFVIEHSNEFKNKFIILLMSQDVPGQHPRAAVPKTKDTSKAKAAPKKEDENSKKKDGENNAIIVEVPDKNDAVEYLKEHYPDKDYTQTQLRTKTAFEAACQECKVKFMFTAEQP